MTSNPRDLSDTLTGDETISLTLRLKTATHAQLEEVKTTTGRSLNALINEACEHALAPAGGATQIVVQRRRLIPRGKQGEQAWAALAYILGYLGQDRQARRAWPWKGRFNIIEGDPKHLPLAGALLACEIDITKG